MIFSHRTMSIVLMLLISCQACAMDTDNKPASKEKKEESDKSKAEARYQLRRRMFEQRAFILYHQFRAQGRPLPMGVVMQGLLSGRFR